MGKKVWVVKTKKGFTLVEVIVVLVILAILAAILIPAYIGYIQKAEKQECALNRGQLNRAFLGAYVDSKELRDAQTKGEVTAITGSDVASYLKDNQWYEGDTECPVYEAPYDFDFKVVNGKPIVSFTCPCVDKFSSYRDLANELVSATVYYGAGREVLIKALWEENGGFLTVDEETLSGTRFEKGKELYWKPYWLGDRSTLIFFSNETDYDGSGNNAQGSWRGRILNIDGEIYVAKEGINASVSYFYKYNSTEDLINSSEFKNQYELKK